MFQVSITVRADDEDRLTGILFSLGAGSVSSCESDYKEVVLMGLFDDIREVQSFFSEDQYVVQKIGDEVWKYRWLEFFQGYPVSDTIYIIPVTSDHVPPGQYSRVIRMDPRDAFGDGRHPTTSLCLVKLEEALLRMDEDARAGLQLLDVGTGTGVLSILAALMGVRSIDAIDIEDIAVENARYNARINGCDHISFFTSGVAEFSEGKSYDLVIANLLTWIVKENIGKLVSLVKDSGTLIVSGISNMWHEEASGIFGSAGLVLVEHESRDGWNCYIMKKS